MQASTASRYQPGHGHVKTPTRPALPGISSLVSATNELIRAAALNDSPVLLTGEPGTEKSFAAKLIHQHSNRSTGPIVKLTVSWKLPPNLSEYFERCDGGTLIIHLQKEFPIDMQYTLVELTSHGGFADPMSGELVESDIRIILMSNLDIDEMARRTPFLPDLQEILTAQHIEIPPLHSRGEDIPALVRYAIGRARETGKTSVAGADPQVLALFRQWDWPGNAEDLLLVTAQAAISAKGRYLTLDDLPESFLRQLHPEAIETARSFSTTPHGDAARHPPTPAALHSPATTATDHRDHSHEEADIDPDTAPSGGMEAAGTRAMETPAAGSSGASHHDTRGLRVLQLARRLNAQSQLLSRQMSGPLPAAGHDQLLERLMVDVTDEAALGTLENELDRGLELVLAMRRQLALLNVRQQQTQETIRDLVNRLSYSDVSSEETSREIADEAADLADTLKAIDQIVRKVATEMPRTGEHLETMIQGNLLDRLPSTSGIFRRLEESGEGPGGGPSLN